MLRLKVILQNRARRPHTPSKKYFQQWAQAALPPNAPPAELTIRIVGVAESARLNELYRAKKGPTNVLSFTYEAPIGSEELSLGDLVLCADLVETEAQSQGKSGLSHWAHLTVHGVLHLQGYDHIKLSQAKKMEQLEVRILNGLGFPDPYHPSKE